MRAIKKITLCLVIMIVFMGNRFLSGQNVWDGTSVPTTTVTGDVGIGTGSPLFDLHVIGSSTMGTVLIAPNETGSGDDAQLRLVEDHNGTYGMRWVYDGGVNRMYAYGFSGSTNYGPHIAINRNDGRVGIGTTSPISWAELDVYDDDGDAYIRISGTGNGYQFAGLNLTSDEATDKQWEILHKQQSGKLNHLHFAYNDGSTWKTPLVIKPTGEVGIATMSPGKELDVNGTTRTKVLEITGGADIAEPFDILNGESIKPGMVVCIDPDQQGQLRISSRAYDRTVAGIVSGAGGINPGMLMSQSVSGLNGRHPLALTGRVFCWADASNGSIKPGDLLTTSDVEGHAMKVTHHTKAQGAIIGKSMTSLAEGKGLILVLVTLQ